MAKKPEIAYEELLEFLCPESREDVKHFALNYVLGLTASKEGMKFVENHPKLLEKVAKMTRDKTAGIKKDACVFLLNASASPLVVTKLDKMKIYEDVLPQLLDKECKHADKFAMLLSNMTRMDQDCLKCFQEIQKCDECSLEQLLEVLCVEKYNKYTDLDHIATFLANMSRLPQVRNTILDSNKDIIQRLLPFLSFPTLPRRKGVARILRNCCFQYECHEWLLGESVDILPCLLLPLAGPEEFTESEMDGLPLELQYLEDSKSREGDAEIRKLLVEALTLLCSKKFGREYMKDKNAYVIIRELHNYEQDEDMLSVVENLVQILIGDEPCTEMENLHEIDIPDDIRKKFEEQEKT